MRTITRTIAAASLTAAATAGTLTAGTTAAVADDPRCVGFPSLPVTYACLVSATPQNALPTVNPNGGQVVVPSFCYVLGCTGDIPVATPQVLFGEGTVVVITHNNRTYTVPADPTDLLAGPDVIAILQDLARKVNAEAEIRKPSQCVMYGDGSIQCA